MDLSVIILSWNTKDELDACLTSLRRELDAERAAPNGLQIEVIVVDNGSADCSAELVETQHRWAQLIRLERNIGFSAGNNAGIREARGRDVLLLNTDTVVHPGALRALVVFAAQHPEAGIIGPRLLNADGSIQYSCRTFPTLANGFFRNTFLGRLFPRNRFNRRYLLTDWDHSSARAVDWVSGAAMFIRREVLDQVGLLDEGFFMYCEDVDLCYRARQAGWEVWYCPDAVITHFIARASDKNAAAMIAQRHLSMYRFFRKHYAKRSNPLVWPLVVCGLAARVLVLVIRNRVDVWRMRRKR
jgi:GT2 family glycosyltransferase